VEKPHVFITRRILEAGLKMISQSCDMEIWPENFPPTPKQLREKVRGMQGILCMLSDRMDGELMDCAGEGLKVISAYAVGVDNIDVAEATRRGIAVGNTPGVLTDATADLAFGLLLAAARRISEADRMVRAGQWKTWGPTTLLGADVHGATLGIVGFGRIGQAIARRAHGFDMRVLYSTHGHAPKKLLADSKAEEVDFDTLLQESDFISLNVPLTAETRRMMNKEAFDKMKPGAILVNTARGGVVDQQALAEALSSGKLAGAALDVTDPEPIPADSPLLKLENVIIVPHIGSASTRTRERMAVMAAENLLAGLRGERLPYCVNPQVYG
jgi:glyoxylate reductase